MMFGNSNSFNRRPNPATGGMIEGNSIANPISNPVANPIANPNLMPRFGGGRMPRFGGGPPLSQLPLNAHPPGQSLNDPTSVVGPNTQVTPRNPIMPRAGGLPGTGGLDLRPMPGEGSPDPIDDPANNQWRSGGMLSSPKFSLEEVQRRFNPNWMRQS